MVIMMELQLQPLAAEAMACLPANPDRGLRLELYMGEEIACDVFTVSRMANPAAHIERVIEKGIARCAPEQITLAQVYFYLTGYRGGEIDEAGFQAMQIYFDTLRAHGLKALLRFAYSTDPGVNDATQADMLRHIEQLRPFLERNKAYIHVLQAGMIGAWGEWHSEKKRVSRKKILRALAQAAPEGMYLQVRLPGCSSCSVSGTLPIAGLGCTTTLFSVISRRSNMKTAALTRARACIARLWRNRRRAHRMASFIGAVGTMQMAFTATACARWSGWRSFTSLL